MKKIVLVGAGARAFYMFAKPLVTEWKENIEFAGVFDSNQVRANKLSEACGGISVFQDFQVMMDTVKPDTVIVASTDDTHHEYIISALHADCDVITEKPMTIDEQNTVQILEAEKKSGKKVLVTFNLRFAPYFAAIKKLLAEGVLGQVNHIDLEWYLDRRHGADYFRRWHAEMKNSGGLLVHKSSHHFDIVNWWMDAFPEELHAFGTKKAYGNVTDKKGFRCLTCDYKKECQYYLDINNETFLKEFYLQAEMEDGYIRDRCVFDDRIDIYDHMSVNVRYDNDALLTYSLVANSPYEGWRASINGSEGRMEIENSYKNADMEQQPFSVIKIFKADGELEEVRVDTSAAGHGGGDQRLREMLFGDLTEDHLGQQANSISGAMALLIGAVANESIKDRQVKKIPDIKKYEQTGRDDHAHPQRT